MVGGWRLVVGSWWLAVGAALHCALVLCGWRLAVGAALHCALVLCGWWLVLHSSVLWSSENKVNTPFLVKSVDIFYNMVLIKTDTTNFIKSLHGKCMNIRVKVN